MTAIAGVMTADGAAPARGRLERMEAALAHRAPHGGDWHVRDGVALWQGRDASLPREARAAGGAVVVVDGPVPHGPDELLALLRQRLDLGGSGPRQGHAAAAHEPAEERLLLARDGFGIRPLYYAESSDGFAFASQPRALLDGGFAEAAVADEPRDELLQLQFTTGRDTIFPRIARVLPGEVLSVQSGRIVARAERPALMPPTQPIVDEAAGLAALDAALGEAFEAALPARGPAGLYLSAGVDSSVLLALWQRSGAPPPVIFAAGFEAAGAPDHRDQVAALGRQAGARVVHVGVGEQDFWRLLPAIAAATDDPTADYALLVSWKLAEAAAREVTTVMSGEGGDELFAGYGRHRAALRPWWMGGPRALWPHGRFDRLRVLRRQPTAWRDGIRAHESVIANRGFDDLQRLQVLDCMSWLAHDLLVKLDRSAGAHGLETRLPLLDPAVAKVALALVPRLKVNRHTGKLLLRRWLARELPESQPFARREGQSAPLSDWLAGRGDTLGPLVARQAGVAEIAHPDRVPALFRSRNRRTLMAAWTLLYYALWHRRHIEGRLPAGEVFETLADG